MNRARVATAVAWAAAGLWAAWALIRLFGLEWGFPLIQLIAFTPLVAAASPLLLALAVLPRAVGGPTEPDGGTGPTLRVLAANMKLGKADPDELVQLVAELDVDVLSVEELTPALAKALDRAGLGELLPLETVSAEPGSFGGGLYVRGRRTTSSTVALPGGFPLVRAGLVLPGAPPVEVYSVHTQPPTPSRSTDWDDDLRALPSPTDASLRILLGDFNATLDHDEFRSLLDRGYDDAAASLGDGLTPTWPEDRRFPPLVTIDHVLVDERIGIRDYSTHEIARSDHRAVFAELALPAGPAQ